MSNKNLILDLSFEFALEILDNLTSINNVVSKIIISSKRG